MEDPSGNVLLASDETFGTQDSRFWVDFSVDSVDGYDVFTALILV
jgi:hypothetical protein